MFFFLFSTSQTNSTNSTNILFLCTFLLIVLYFSSPSSLIRKAQVLAQTSPGQITSAYARGDGRHTFVMRRYQKRTNCRVVFDPDGKTSEPVQSTLHPCHSNLYFNATCSVCHPSLETFPALDPCKHMYQCMRYGGLDVVNYSAYTRSMRNFEREIETPRSHRSRPPTTKWMPETRSAADEYPRPNTSVYFSTKNVCSYTPSETLHQGHETQRRSVPPRAPRMEGVGQRVHKPLLGVADTNHLLSIHIWVMHGNAEQLI